MNRGFGLSPTNKKYFKKRSSTLKLIESPLSKNNTRKNSINSKYEKRTLRVKKEPNLQKANNTILNFISSCMEKIKDDKNDEAHITPHLAGILEMQRVLKKERSNIKKEIQLSSNNGNNNDYQRAFSRKSYKTNKVCLKNLSSVYQIHVDINNLNKVNFEQNIKSQRNNEIIEKKGSKNFKRIATSKFVKEKEKEIVYNISTSLISLYKPNNNENFSNYIKKNNIKPKEPEKSKFKILPKKKSLSNINDKFSKNKNKRKSTNEEKFNSNFSIDNKNIKKPNIKRFKTFIKLNNKIKTKNNKKRRNSSNKLLFNRSFFHNKSDKSLNDNINSNSNNNQIEEKEENKRRSKDTFNPLNWANELKNRENLTQIEYVHIGQDLRQSLIGYENKLEEEMKHFDKTETTDLIRHLPTMKNKRNNYKLSFCSNKFEDNLLNINIKDLNLKDNIKLDKEKFRLLQHTGYVYDSLDDEEAEDAIEINYYYINPDSIFIYIFDSIIAILSFYCVFYIPYYLAHDSFLNLSYLKFNNFFFHFIDNFYIIDLIISFFRAFYNYEEILIKNVPEMSCHYINNWFFIDSLSAIPFYSILFFFERKSKNIRTFSYNPINLNLNEFSTFGVKLDKIHYLIFMNKLLKIFKCFSDNNRALTKLFNILSKSNIIEEKSDIFFVIFILFITLHFGTCIFIFIGRNSYPSWINAMQIENESFTHIYLCSLYYLIATITTVGYGDIYGRTIKEIIFQIILLIIGTCTYSYLISVVSNFIKKKNEKSLIFENKLKILNEIKLTNPHLQDSLYEKLLRFLRYKKNTEKNNQTIIINSLPYTLKNSLIIEMYKPIINNFIIFKGLQNSNCIVQLVTAFKPIYAIKNDILIQEGDFIEEVIFVKNGIISLEIGINFNKPKESIVQYLDRIGKNDRMSISSVKNNNTLQDTTINGITETSTFFQNMKSIIKPDKKENKNIRYLKVLDIRKNEHFGETLMFFNERSFLNAKVKSKKAELFFLKKEEVIKIFSSFPNIWNRINKKSIYNMRQIKITVRNVLLKFCNMVGINLDNSIEKEKNSLSITSNINKKKGKIKKDGKKNKEIDDDENSLLNNIKKENRKKRELKKSITCKIEDKDIISENNENTNNNEKMNLDKVNNRNSIMSQPSVFENINNESTIYNIKKNTLRLNSNSKSNNISRCINNSSKNLISNNELNESPNKIINNSFKDLVLNVNKNNKNIEDNNKNSDYSSKETVKVSMNKKVCTLIDSDSINDENLIKNIQYNINDEIYKNENFNINCTFEDESLKSKNVIKSYLNNNITIEDLYKKVMEKTWVKNLEIEKINCLDKLLNPNVSDNNINKLLNKESNLKKEKNNMILRSNSSSYINNLETTDTESFEILASYENINDITCNKYIKNQILRKKTKEFLLKECSNSFNEPKTNESRISSESNLFKTMIFENTNRKRKNKLIKMNSDSINKSDIILRRKKEAFQNNKRGSMPSFKYKREGSTPKIKITTKSTLKNRQFLSISQLDIYKNNNAIKKSSKNNLETQNKSAILADENMSFYDKYNTNNHSYDLIEKQSTVKKRKKQVSDLAKIKDIIKKDAQNLNQPSLYYQQLFLNQIQKRKENKNNINHKSNEYTLLPVSRNKISNNINLNIKRTSTELKNLKNNLVFSSKKYNRRLSKLSNSKNK